MAVYKKALLKIAELDMILCRCKYNYLQIVPQLDFSSLYSQVLWLSISFILTFIATNKFFVPKLKQIMMERDTLIKQNISIAEKSINGCNNLKTELENTLKKARLQATVLRERAYIEAQEFIYSESEKIEKMLLKNENKELEKLNRYRVKNMESIEALAKNISADVINKLFAISNVSREVKN